jgi:RNA polymerase sigma-70 factor (ECF subfamily)
MSFSSEVADLYVSLRGELCQFLRTQFGEGPPDPEDMVQSAFIKYAAVKDRSGIENPRAYLYAAARNLTIDELRRNDRTRGYVNGEISSDDAEKLDQISPEHVLLAKERYAIVHETIAAMSAVQREALTLHRLEDLSMDAISKRMGISKTTVHRLIADAMLGLHLAVTAKTRERVDS